VNERDILLPVMLGAAWAGCAWIGPDLHAVRQAELEGSLPPATLDEVRCPPLDPVPADAERVGPDQAAELEAILASAAPGSTVALEDGTYVLDRHIVVTVDGLTLRSVSGDPDAVVITGSPGTIAALQIEAPDVTIAEMTIQDEFEHGLRFKAAATGASVVRMHFLDVQSDAIKVDPSGSPWADGGEIRCSHFALSEAGLALMSSDSPKGVGLQGTGGWAIRDATFEGFFDPGSLAPPVIAIDHGSFDTVVERLHMRDVELGVKDGLTGSPMRPLTGYCAGLSAAGTIIRNVMIATVDSRASLDAGVSLDMSCQAVVVHNTIATVTEPFSSIEWRAGVTQGLVQNNLSTHPMRDRDGAVAAIGNIEDAAPTDFVDLLAGDLHLVELAEAIDQGEPLGLDAPEDDYDGDPRDLDPDVGADEWVGP